MPSGPVSWETVMWLVSVIVAASGVVVPMVLAAWRLHQSLTARIEAAEARAAAVEQVLRAELAATMQHVAETYATKSGVTAAVERIEGSVERLTGQVEQSLDRLSGRIDRLLEVQIGHPAPQRRRTST